MTDRRPPGHLSADEPFAGTEEIDLSMATWMGISGAAISTGLGQNTSLGLSLLAGLSNLRLGVWWLPRTRRSSRRGPSHWVPVQIYLLREFLGWFRGPHAEPERLFWRRNNRLYLTDGGHFENTGVYELVRRRVPLIVSCDNGADPDYQFADVVNLTRKLRIDFNASVDFLPRSHLDDLLGEDSPVRGMFGEISELVAYSREGRSQGPYAAIARIRRPQVDDLDGKIVEPPYLATLILLKPRLSGLEMIDLLDYNRANQQFPQQSTGDQFFDEAQWESYFRLGQHIAGLVFSDPTRNAQTYAPPTYPRRWMPHRLEPVSADEFPWFAQDWTPEEEGRERAGAAGGGAVTAPPDVAVAAAPVPRAGINLGFWSLLAAGAASVGTLGATFGISEALTTSVVHRISAEETPTVSMTLDDEFREMISEGIAVRPDPAASATLVSMLAKLDRLMQAMPTPQHGQGGSDIAAASVAIDLGSIRQLMAKFVSTQDPTVLRRLEAEVRGLRSDARLRGAAIVGRVDQLDDGLKKEIRNDLEKVEAAVREAGPRTNARSGR